MNRSSGRLVRCRPVAQAEGGRQRRPLRAGEIRDPLELWAQKPVQPEEVEPTQVETAPVETADETARVETAPVETAPELSIPVPATVDDGVPADAAVGGRGMLRSDRA